MGSEGGTVKAVVLVRVWEVVAEPASWWSSASTPVSFDPGLPAASGGMNGLRWVGCWELDRKAEEAIVEAGPKGPGRFCSANKDDRRPWSKRELDGWWLGAPGPGTPKAGPGRAAGDGRLWLFPLRLLAWAVVVVEWTLCAEG